VTKRIIGLHLQEGAEREENDFYATHPSTIPPLLELLGWQGGGKVIRENSCGQGHLSEPMLAAGHRVISTDLIDRGYGLPNVDFLSPSWVDKIPVDAVVMNPPYKHLDEFILKSLELAPVVAMFVPINKLEGEKRYESVYSIHKPSIVAVFVRRQKCVINAEFENPKLNKNTKCYAWIIWTERFRQADPITKFIF